MLELLLLVVTLGLPEVSVGIVGAADSITTEIALHHQGLSEGNPTMTSPAMRIGVKALATAGIIAASSKLRRTGHKNAARAVCWAAVAVWTSAAVWNYRQAQIRR